MLCEIALRCCGQAIEIKSLPALLFPLPMMQFKEETHL
jgi:hypothetical protein